MKRFRKYPEKWIFTSRAYGENVQAMTAENLHSKMDIAAELAWRDDQIAQLQAERENVLALLNKHGVCKACGEMYSHWLNEPYASCDCAQSEWYELTPYMKLEARCEELGKERDQIRAGAKDSSDYIHINELIGDKCQLQAQNENLQKAMEEFQKQAQHWKVGHDHVAAELKKLRDWLDTSAQPI